MKNRDKASYLLDEMSNIDDRFLFEAESFKGRGIRYSLKKTLAAAAVIAVCICSIMWYQGVLGSLNKGDTNNAAPPAKSFDEMLLSHKDSSSALRCEFVEFGKDMLVWQYDGDDGYYVLELKGEANQMAELIGNGKKISYEESEKQTVKLWFCSKNGEVYSPELLKSNGNVGYKCLFDYNSEIEPSEELTSSIDSLLSEF